MKNFRKKSVFLFFILFSLFVQVFFSGCSDSSPEIARCSATVVFSYNDESSIHYEKLHSDVLFLKDHYIKEKEKLEKQLKEIK